MARAHMAMQTLHTKLGIIAITGSRKTESLNVHCNTVLHCTRPLLILGFSRVLSGVSWNYSAISYLSLLPNR